MAFGERNVVEVERVPGFDRTADVALAQMDARALLLTQSVGEAFRVRVVMRIRQAVVPVPVEGDRQIERLEFVGPSKICRPLVDQTGPRRPLRNRHRLVAEHGLHSSVIGLKIVPLDLRGPAALKSGLLGVDGDVGVNERPPADARPLHDGHVREHAEVEPAVGERGMAIVPQPRVARLARVVLDLPAAAALEDEDAIATLRRGVLPRRNRRTHCLLRSRRSQLPSVEPQDNARG